MTAPRAPLAGALLEPRTQRFALVAVAALILLARIGRGTLANYDDCYYAEKAHEMLAGGDWLTPHFSGVMRLDNPPLFLWLIAASFRFFGAHDWAAILPSALAGVACVAVLHRLAMRLGADPFRAWCGSVVLLTTNYFLKYSDHAMLDVFLTLLFVLAMLAYRSAWEGSLRAWAAIGLLVGLGIMTKSVLGVFPLVVAWLHAAWSRRWRVAFGAGPLLALLLAVLVPAPWYATQLRLHREAFLTEHVRWLIWQRGFVIGRSAQTLGSHFAYFTEIARIDWPWLPFALVGVWTSARAAFARGGAGPRDAAWSPRDSARLLLLWPAVVLGVMSLVNEKKLWYVMSAFPALALLAALPLSAWARSVTARRRTVLAGFALLALAGLVLAFTPWGLPPRRQPDVQDMADVARARVPASDAVLFAGGNYFAIAHQFVYYSGRRLDQRPPSDAAVRAALDERRWVLFDAARHDSIVGADSLAYPAVAASGNWRLVHAAGVATGRFPRL
jgi:4-amino-4-deoxy-L-arabinose transferase